MITETLGRYSMEWNSGQIGEVNFLGGNLGVSHDRSRKNALNWRNGNRSRWIQPVLAAH